MTGNHGSHKVAPRQTEYGRLSVLDTLGIFSKFLFLPFVLIWTLIFRWWRRTRKRSLYDGYSRYILTQFNIPQCQFLFGTTKARYFSWCKNVKQEPNVETIGEGANLLWLGERKLEKVILVFHGGAFLFPPTAAHVKFWGHVRTKLGGNVSVAMLEYTLGPVAVFPTPLKQAVTAISHLISLGVQPQNIQLAGDSAGGNLILQVLAHLLHPLEYENVPSLSLSAPLKGAYLMSPWVDLADVHGTLKNGDSTDLMDYNSMRLWGGEVLRPVPKDYLGYIQASSARDDWFKGVDAFVDRVLITAGREECLKEEINRFKSVFAKFHSHVSLEEHQGVHDDPLFAVEVGESGGGAPDMIIEWLRAGF